MSIAALIRCASSQSRSADRVGLPLVEGLLGEARAPGRSPRRGSRRRQGRGPAGTSFWERRRGRSRPSPGAGSRSPARAAGSACAARGSLPASCSGDAGADAVFEVGDLQPAMQTGLGDPEVLRDLGDRRLALAGDRDTSRRNSRGNGLGMMLSFQRGRDPHRPGVNRTRGRPHLQRRAWLVA